MLGSPGKYHGPGMRTLGLNHRWRIRGIDADLTAHILGEGELRSVGGTPQGARLLLIHLERERGHRYYRITNSIRSQAVPP